jgi:hypothetical protein
MGGGYEGDDGEYVGEGNKTGSIPGAKDAKGYDDKLSIVPGTSQRCGGLMLF